MRNAKIIRNTELDDSHWKLRHGGIFQKLPVEVTGSTGRFRGLNESAPLKAARRGLDTVQLADRESAGIGLRMLVPITPRSSIAANHHTISMLA